MNCHCITGRLIHVSILLQTRAEILEMVVKQIKELKQKNADLQTQINKLPTTTSKFILCTVVCSLTFELHCNIQILCECVGLTCTSHLKYLHSSDNELFWG